MPDTFTPGPWHRNIKPATRYPTIWSGRNTHVAYVVTGGGLTPEAVEANIRLIAAAPDMLAFIERVAATKPVLANEAELLKGWLAMIAEARGIAAKAQGEQP